jgi:hypothetical protein
MNDFWKNIKILFTLPIVLVLAWIVAHLMAIFGVFAVVAYPIWVLFFGKRSICLGCARVEDGEVCPLCNEKVEHKEIYPKNGRSIILNSFVILFLTGISIGVVYLENMVIDASGLLSSGKTVSFNIPEKHQYRTNEIFPMKIEISGINTAINVVQADITFDPEVLEVVELSIKESFATIFVQKDINNSLGYVRLSGGIPSPGYSKETGTFGTIYFKAKSSGLANVAFLPTSMVLADDGRGTNVLKNFPSVSYIIKPEALSTEEEVSQAELFKKDVLGAKTENKGDICEIVLGETVLPEDVLGISDNDEIDDDVLLEEKGAFYRYVIHPFIDLLHRLDTIIITIYQNVFGNLFTKE